MTSTEILGIIAAVVAVPLALWAWLSVCAVERMWRDHEDEAIPEREGWDAVRKLDQERKHD